VSPSWGSPGGGGDGDGPGSLSALLILDRLSGALLFTDAAAQALFGLGDDPAGVAPRRLLPQLIDLSPREFVARIRLGQREHEVSVSVEALVAGPFNTADAVLVRVRGSDKVPPSSADERARRRESLWSLMVRRGFSGAEQVRALLREGVVGLGAEAAILGRIEDGELHVVQVVGPADVGVDERLPLARTPARDAVRRAGTFAVEDTAGDGQFKDLVPPARSFSSVAFRVGQAQWCVSFISSQARALPFDDDDWAYIEFLCEALSRAIERSESDAALELRANSDDLTGLPNRGATELRLDESIAEAQRLEVAAAVLFVDMDGFSSVNDTVSHEAGDAVLREVADRLRTTVRREEFIGRWGGDEFVIILMPVKSIAQIEAVANRITTVLAEPFAAGGSSFTLGASIGVAQFPDDETDARRLLAAADAAMYRAKEDGGACIRFHDGRRAGGPHVPPRAPEEPAVEAPVDTPPAGRGEVAYVVIYEPIYHLRDGDVGAAEAQLRRVDAERGLLGAAQSRSVEDDPQTRREADAWLLRETLELGRTLAASGFELAYDLRLAAYDAGVLEAMSDGGFGAADWRRIRISVCAAEAAQPTAVFEDFLEACARFGVGFVLDWFDGSLASLHAVSNLPVYTLRIGSGVIERTAAQPGGLALLEGTLAGARALGWRMIASGVETLEQRDFVVELGVDGVQGPYVARAMTASDFVAWLAARREPPQES
jgi:diguanylate cyclase (GGDEF)-like protein